jgi:hypothetical protein
MALDEDWDWALRGGQREMGGPGIASVSQIGFIFICFANARETTSDVSIRQSRESSIVVTSR